MDYRPHTQNQRPPTSVRRVEPLNQLRARFPDVTSILMDESTLLDHRTQFVTEPHPTRAAQQHLTEAEQALYRDLIEDRFGPSVRLEQERIRFSAVRRAIALW